MNFVFLAGSELKVVRYTYACTSNKSAHVFIENVFLVIVMLSMLKLFFRNCFDVCYYDCVWIPGISLQCAGMLQGGSTGCHTGFYFGWRKKYSKGSGDTIPPDAKWYNASLDNFRYCF